MGERAEFAAETKRQLEMTDAECAELYGEAMHAFMNIICDRGIDEFPGDDAEMLEFAGKGYSVFVARKLYALREDGVVVVAHNGKVVE